RACGYQDDAGNRRQRFRIHIFFQRRTLQPVAPRQGDKGCGCILYTNEGQPYASRVESALVCDQPDNAADEGEPGMLPQRNNGRDYRSAGEKRKQSEAGEPCHTIQREAPSITAVAMATFSCSTSPLLTTPDFASAATNSATLGGLGLELLQSI